MRKLKAFWRPFLAGQTVVKAARVLVSHCMRGTPSLPCSAGAKLAALAIFVFANAPVLAENTSTTLDTHAGLSPVFSVTCTPISFGVLLMPARQTTTYTIAILSRISDTLEIFGETAGVASSNTAGHTPKRGECTVTGADVPDGTVLQIWNSGAEWNALGPDSSNFYAGVPAPPVPHTGIIVAVTTQGDCKVVARTALCYMGGEMRTPGPILKSNWGSYKVVQSIGQVFYDQVGP